MDGVKIVIFWNARTGSRTMSKYFLKMKIISEIRNTGFPKNIFAIPKNKFAIPKNKFVVPKNKFAIPKNIFAIPKIIFVVAKDKIAIS